MATVRLAQKHNLGAEEAKRRVQGMESSLHQQYGLDVNWTGNHGTFHGDSVDGAIDVRDDRVAIAMRLGLKAGLFAGRIREKLAVEINRALHS